MLRVYWNSNKHTLSEPIQSLNVSRIEGGSWFCEEATDTRHVFKVVLRKCIGGIIMEYTEELASDFIQTPCWPGVPQRRELVRSEAPWSLWQVLEGESEQVLLVLSGPRGAELPVWVVQEVGPQNSAALKQWQSKASCALPVSSDLADHAPLEQQRQVQQGVSPSQKKLQTLSSAGKPRARLQEELNSSKQESAQARPQRPLQQAAASGGQKAVQTGSLCPPMNLPDEQPPRRSPHHLPRHRQPPLPKRAAIPQECLIDLAQS
jgi:hypothetical protein